MQSDEVFLAFHMTSRINADSLLYLKRLHCYALFYHFWNTRSRVRWSFKYVWLENGLKAKLSAENSMALYLYFICHQLNLVVQNSLVSNPEVIIALERMYAVVHFIKNSL